MKDKADLTDKQLLAMGRRAPKKIKRTLFKQYAGTYVNLGLTTRDSKTIRKELPAIAKRGAELIAKDILRKTQMPTRLAKNQQPFITVLVYPGIVKTDKNGKETFVYPEMTEEYKIEEV